MTRMAREEWYDIARDLDWELSYVDYEAVFPEWMSGQGKIPREAWATWDEPYKVTYPEYVATQREKETGAYSVKAVLQKSRVFDQLDEGWKSVAKEHFGAVALIEDLAAYAELRMARFGLSPAWRNMAIFGALDETRHTQISLYFPHALVGKDPQYDWAHKAYHTNQWAVIAARATFDGMMMNPNVVDVAVQLPFTFETGFTNVQFVALAADALESGDINFANMISSIQTDEARHSQQGGPTLEILVEHDPRPVDHRQDLLGVRAAVRRPDRPGHGLLHAAADAQAVLRRVHAGMDRRAVRRPAPRLRAEKALVLGRVHGGPGHLAPLAAPRRLVLAPDRVVETAGRRVPRGARMAPRQVPAMGRAVRPGLGHDHRQRQRRPDGAHPPGDAAVAVQPVPPAHRHRRLAAQREVPGAQLPAQIQRLHLPLLLAALQADLVGGPGHPVRPDGDRAAPRRRDPAADDGGNPDVDGPHPGRHG